MRSTVWCKQCSVHKVDFAIVISGVLDEWLVDLLSDGHGHNALLALRIMQPLRFFGRAFRFLRYLRLLRFLLTSDLAWVESGWFQGAVGVMIILNAVFMGIDCIRVGVRVRGFL